MTENAGPADPAFRPPADGTAFDHGALDHGALDHGAFDHGPQARFEVVPASERRAAATVRAVGDIDLTNIGQFQAALDEAAAASTAVTADLTAVTYCDSAGIRALFHAARKARLTVQVSSAGSVTETLLKISGLDQLAAVVTLG
jgi:anti-sigma B factor antagonist